jgi:integrase
VELNGKQIPLGKDERYSAPPKVRPKEPPQPVQKRYVAAMQSRAEPEDRRLSFCIGKYIESMADCEPNSIRRSRDYLNRFRDEVGDVKVSKLKAHHVADFLKGKPWSKNTERQVIITVNACLNHCVRQDWIDRNPIKGKVTMPRATRREDIMAAGDAERLIAAAPGPLKDVLSFLAGTGCRPIEARGARIEKCDLEKGILMVPNKTRKKTGDQERPVFLSTVMIAFLRGVIGERTEGWIFVNGEGEHWLADTLRKRMERLCERLGIDHGARLYSSRHNFISDAINKKGMNPAMVAIQSGHKDLKMLMDVYLHSDHEAMRRELDKG